jgi:hypothetical protein
MWLQMRSLPGYDPFACLFHDQDALGATITSVWEGSRAHPITRFSLCVAGAGRDLALAARPVKTRGRRWSTQVLRPSQLLLRGRSVIEDMVGELWNGVAAPWASGLQVHHSRD